jgi:hypothetical protein
MLKDFHQIFPLFANVVMPILAGLVFFAMAKYVQRIGPLRTLIAGELTYKGPTWVFLPRHLSGLSPASNPFPPSLAA